ncbi:MAG: AbrB family transcriptional regulator [Gammaproteobacteria bacterium]|nr:AbrB family transcriptional regulator [Gammaproteobacteria bacterium]
MIQRYFPRERLYTIVYGIFGTACFWYFDLPLPFLFGPMAASLVVALMGGKPAGFGRISIFARTILGVAVGASITPEVIESLPDIAKSVALVPVYLGLVGVLGYAYFRRIHKFDPPTAYFSAMPGGLQDMIIFGEEAGGNPRTLSLIHATRVLVIVTIAPVLLTGAYGAVLSHPIGSPALDLPWHELVLMLVAALFGWKIAERLGLFGASILGPLIAAALLSLGGLIHSRPPAEAILFCQFFIGAGIGVHYVGVTLRELRQVVSAATLYVLLLAIVAAIFARIATSYGFAEPVEAFLAFVPAGQAEIAILAIVVGADLGFVVTHHLVRITLVILGAPLIANRVRVSKPRD